MALSDSACEQEILDAVAEYGWFCTAVHDPDGREPDFAYSVGFTETLRQPEVIVFGLPHEVAHGLLWEVFRTLQGGKGLEDGEVWSHLLEGYDCVLRRVHPSQVIREHLNSAMWFWGDPVQRGEPLSAFQLVWPDRAGRFPWDRGCVQAVRDRQPALYLPREG